MRSRLRELLVRALMIILAGLALFGCGSSPAEPQGSASPTAYQIDSSANYVDGSYHGRAPR